MAGLGTLRKHRSKARVPGSGRAKKPLRAQNKKLLQWLDSWLATQDDRGESWWEDFETDLKGHRLTFRPTQTG